MKRSFLPYQHASFDVLASACWVENGYSQLVEVAIRVAIRCCTCFIVLAVSYRLHNGIHYAGLYISKFGLSMVVVNYVWCRCWFEIKLGSYSYCLLRYCIVYCLTTRARNL